MKCKKFNLAILMMVVAAFISVAVVSCKKDNEANRLVPTNTEEESFAPPQVDDMNAYLKGFKEKMKSSTKGEDEMLSLEEAAWHLSSLANYEFADADVPYNDIRFDTIYGHVTVTNGMVTLTDLNVAYNEMSAAIDAFRENLNLENHHFQFIGSSISADGEVMVRLVSLYGWFVFGDHLWYFPDVIEANEVCDEYFNLYEHYYASQLGRSELERVMNILESRSTDNTGRVYYVIYTTKTYCFRDHIDPYGSPSYLNSRLFADVLDRDIKEDMCYYLDSGMGLGHEGCPTGQDIISWQVVYEFEQPYEQYHEHLWKATHKLIVNYGIAHSTQQWDD